METKEFIRIWTNGMSDFSKNVFEEDIKNVLKKQVVEFADYLNDQNMLVNKEAAEDCYDEWICYLK